MNRLQRTLKRIVIKHGNIITACAFAFAILTTNSSSVLVYYEPSEPEEIDLLKKSSNRDCSDRL